MGVDLQKIDIQSDKWRQLVERLNEIINVLSTQILTTGGNPVKGNVIVNGSIFGNPVYSNNQKTVTEDRKINTINGLAGGGSLNADLTLTLDPHITEKIERGGSSLQADDFKDKVGLKEKIIVPDDLETVGQANNISVLFGDGAWRSIKTIGNMSSLIYDPNDISKDAFNMDNMVEGSRGLILTSGEREKIKTIDTLSDSLKKDYLKLDGSNAMHGNLTVSTGDIVANSGNIGLFNVDTGDSISYGDTVPGGALYVGNKAQNTSCLGRISYNYTKVNDKNSLPTYGKLSFTYNAYNEPESMRLDKNGLYVNETISGKQIVSRNDVSAFSDVRLKTDLTVITDPLDKLSKINGYTYTRIDNGERQTGVIAQEVEKVLPEVVKNVGETKVVAYGNMIGLLIEAIKELSQQVEDLKSKVDK